MAYRNNENIRSKKAPVVVDKKSKIIIVVVVLAVVLMFAVLIDNAVRNPSVKDTTDALNVIFSEGVISNNPEISFDTQVELDIKDPEKIGKYEYYAITVIAGEENKKEYGPYYIRAKDSKIFLKDETTGEMLPYGV